MPNIVTSWCISKALGKPYKFNRPCISDIKWLHLILLIPTHTICSPYLSSPRCLPVGRFLVCSAALRIKELPTIQTVCKPKIDKD
jgi:hypothetical protein